jgi:uncharacterized membrane protein YccC
MRLFLRSVLTGCVLTIGLVCLATISPAESGIAKAAVFLLAPGILAGFAVGSGRIHDLSFWILTAILNAVLYSLLAYGVVLLRRSLRSKATAH